MAGQAAAQGIQISPSTGTRRNREEEPGFGFTHGSEVRRRRTDAGSGRPRQVLVLIAWLDSSGSHISSVISGYDYGTPLTTPWEDWWPADGHHYVLEAVVAMPAEVEIARTLLQNAGQSLKILVRRGDPTSSDAWEAALPFGVPDLPLTHSTSVTSTGRTTLSRRPAAPTMSHHRADERTFHRLARAARRLS